MKFRIGDDIETKHGLRGEIVGYFVEDDVPYYTLTIERGDDITLEQYTEYELHYPRTCANYERDEEK